MKWQNSKGSYRNDDAVANVKSRGSRFRFRTRRDDGFSRLVALGRFGGEVEGGVISLTLFAACFFQSQANTFISTHESNLFDGGG